MVITAHLDGASQSAREHRRELRLEASGATTSGEVTTVLIHNISATGLLLEARAGLTVGEQIGLDLPHAGETTVKVVWASGALFGCEFAEPLSPAALSAAQLRSTGNPDIKLGDAPSVGSADQAFGARLQRLRKERGLTLAQVGAALGVSKPTVWAWENGRARPVDSRIDVLAEALGVTGEELLAAGEGSGALRDLLQRCREQIAEAVGTRVENIKIMVEL